MNKLFKKLNIDTTLTKRVNKSKSSNKVKDNIPLVADYNMMADLLFLPTARFGLKYLFVIVDLATDKFDCEPIISKDSNVVLKAMLKCFERGIISKPEYTLKTDSGSEFKGVFKKYLYDESILHKTSVANRHTSMANVESLNRQLSRLISGFVAEKEKKTGKPFKNWVDFIPIIREELNAYREKKLPEDITEHEYEPVSLYEENPITVKNEKKETKNKNAYRKVNAKFKIGDLVHHYLDWPVDNQGKKQPTAQRREGDINFSIEPKEIVDIFVYTGNPKYRYYLEGMKNVSYPENELIKHVPA